MKTLIFAVAIAAVTALNLAPASAMEYGKPEAGQWHYVWEYHYVGHSHPEYKGGWVLTK
jgi:hypothetical protein